MKDTDKCVLSFQCRLQSPYHSTEKKYKNLLKCSPFILGSTIRGCLLGHMIAKHCTAGKMPRLLDLRGEKSILEFHAACGEPCPVKELVWNGRWGLIVSFGTFTEPEYSARTRISISRDNRVSDTGKLVTLEQINSGSIFSFEIIMQDKDVLLSEVETSLKEIGELFGIGKYKNVGLGRFQVNDMEKKDIKSVLNGQTEMIKTGLEKYGIAFTSPFVFYCDGGPPDMEKIALGRNFSDMLYSRSRDLAEFLGLGITFTKTDVASVNARIIPDFISRYTFEEMRKENRLVAREGSTFELNLKEKNDSFPRMLALCGAFGAGEWADMGFGRFNVIEADHAEP